MRRKVIQKATNYPKYDAWKLRENHWNAEGSLELCYSGLILGLHTANERRCYVVTTSLIESALLLIPVSLRT